MIEEMTSSLDRIGDKIARFNPAAADVFRKEAKRHLVDQFSGPTPPCEGPATVPPIWQIDRSYRKGDEVLVSDHAYRALNDVISLTGFFRYDAASGVICHPDWEFTRKVPRPIHTPSCDAPSCDCATGEDCKANGAAETQAPLGTRKLADFTRTAFIDVGQSGVTLWEDPLVGSIVATDPSGSRVAIMRKGREVSLVDGPCSELIVVRYQAKVDAEPKFADKLRAPISLKDDDLTAKVTGDGAPITLSKPGAGRCFSVQELWDLPDVSDPIATMSGIQSCLDGLTAKVDALAERRDGKAEEDGGPYLVNPNPRFIHTVVVLSEVKEPWSRGYEWRIKGNGAVQIGTLVCAPSEGADDGGRRHARPQWRRLLHHRQAREGGLSMKRLALLAATAVMLSGCDVGSIAVSVHTDANGCQYLLASGYSLTPRMNPEGHQICIPVKER